MSTNKKSAVAVRRGDLVTEVLDRAEAMSMTREEFMNALSYLAGYDPDAVSAALDGVQENRRLWEEAQQAETPAPESPQGTIVINYRGTKATARGATRKNGGAKILADLGWYWLNSIQAYAAPGTDQTDTRAIKAATVLREAGFAVNLVGPEAGS